MADEITIQPSKDPANEGEVLYRVRSGGRFLGSRSYPESEVHDRGHAAIKAEIREWAEKRLAEPRPATTLKEHA